MSRTKKYTIKQKLIKQQIKQKQNTNIINNNNESLNLKIIYSFLKSKNIHKYITEKNNLWYFIDEAVIKVPILNRTTENIMKIISIQLSKNVDDESDKCNICYVSLDDAKKLVCCPQCLTTICYTCCNKTIIYNNFVYMCSFCKYVT